MAAKDQRPYWHTYFLQRNGISPTVYENWNFTTETLCYMTAGARANEIAVEIITRLRKNTSLAKVKPVLIEPCGGIGGNTMAFLDNKDYKMVVTFEQVTSRFEMLRRNVAMYNLGSRSVIINESYNPEYLSDYPGAILYFDPPWMPSDVPGTVANPKDKYFKPGELTVSDLTPEEYLEYYKNHVYMMVWRLPPGFTTKPKGFESKWTIDVVPTKKGSDIQYVTWYCTNLDSELISYVKSVDGPKPAAYKPEVPPSSLKSANELWPLKPIADRPAKVQTSGDVRQDVYVALGEMKLYAPKPDEHFSNESKWKAGLIKYISSLLPYFEVGPDLIPKFFDTEEKLAMWYRVFTHSSYASDTLLNYENIETVGDAVMDCNFKKFHFRTNPKITEHLMSEYTSRFLQSDGLNFLAQQIKITPWCRTADGPSKSKRGGKSDTSLGEDLIESLFGALDLIGDMIRFGFGSCVAYNAIYFFYHRQNFDEAMGHGVPKTIIIQRLGSRIHLLIPPGFNTEQTSTSAVGHTATVSLPDEWIKFYARQGFALKNPVGKAAGTDKPTAIAAAWKNALQVMNDTGITIEWADDYSQAFNFSEFDPTTIANIKARHGVQDLRFEIETIGGIPTITLLGVKSRGETKVISKVSNVDIAAGRRQLIEE